MEPEEEVEKAESETEEKDCGDYPVWRPYGGATSFSEADAIAEAGRLAAYQEELSWKFRTLMGNIMSDDEIESKEDAMHDLVSEYSELVKKPAPTKSILSKIKEAFTGEGDANMYDLVENKAAIKRENGLDYPMRDYAFTPDPSAPATWKLRLTESPGKVTVAQLAKAAAALSSGGFRGNKAMIPPAALASVKRRVRAEYRKLGVQEGAIPASVKALPDDETGGDNPIFLWKNQSGQYEFIAVYSNNLRDDDHPAEILSEKAHKGFAKSLELGIFDTPELWHWHLDGTRFGKVKEVMVVDGFAVALGTIDPGHEQEAEAIIKSKKPLAMSHGMPRQYIVRDPEDNTIINFYASKEISVLPRWAAANKLTSFVVIDSKEHNDMPLSDEQRAHLNEMKLPKSVIDGLDGLGEIGKNAGRESKEAAPAAAITTTDAGDAVVTAELVTRKEVADTLGELFTPLVDAIKQQNELIVQQGAAISNLEAELKELKAVGKAGLAAVVEQTPAASLSDMTRASIFSANSPAKLSDNDPLKGKKPEETDEKARVFTGVSFLDNIIAGSYDGSSRQGG